jgi:hypothetical protein
MAETDWHQKATNVSLVEPSEEKGQVGMVATPVIPALWRLKQEY